MEQYLKRNKLAPLKNNGGCNAHPQICNAYNFCLS